MGGLIVLHGNPLPPTGQLPGRASSSGERGLSSARASVPSIPGTSNPPRSRPPSRRPVWPSPPPAPSATEGSSLTLPTLRSRPVPSHPALREDEDYAGGETVLKPFEVEGLVLPPGRAFDALVAMGEAPDRPGLLLGDDVDYWVAVAAWVLDLLHRRRIVPAVEEGRAAVAARPDRPATRRTGPTSSPRRCPRSSRAVGWPGTTAEGLYPASSFLLRGVVDDMADAAARDLLLEGLPDARRGPAPAPEGLALSLLAARRDGREDEAGRRAPSRRRSPSASAPGASRSSSRSPKATCGSA